MGLDKTHNTHLLSKPIFYQSHLPVLGFPSFRFIEKYNQNCILLTLTTLRSIRLFSLKGENLFLKLIFYTSIMEI